MFTVRRMQELRGIAQHSHVTLVGSSAFEWGKDGPRSGQARSTETGKTGCQSPSTFIHGHVKRDHECARGPDKPVCSVPESAPFPPAPSGSNAG
ncbi:hypothetical protein CTA1_11298 [Colletotrichum tanaceti]|uniref:Uncharacterized protein n=1 Tax=Colletotrichum tanaceti TaxID=1306861 RepID=A0A4U6XMF2_9PEZI|nr:hypothetical protein CTA1_11298 [Colletotrichum tanaceti]